MPLVRIKTPENGTAHGTTAEMLVNGEWVAIPNIMRVEIADIKAGGLVTATIDVRAQLEVVHAHAFLSVESLRAAAAFHGLDLVKKIGPENG